VIPACNEEVPVGDFVDWCMTRLGSADTVGEVLIVDSSPDDTGYLGQHRQRAGSGPVHHDLLRKLPLLGEDLSAYSLETVQMFHRDGVSAAVDL
jgi:hypothetical protein